jgi:IgGFc binding protein
MSGELGRYFDSPYIGTGDPEFVNVVPAGQWLNSYSFYADPSFTETSLVVVRAKNHEKFEHVWLECAGNLTDFRPMGTRGDYECARVDLSRQYGPGQPFGDKTCRTGLQRMRREGPFTATLCGWGGAASYAYPGGMAHRKLVTSPLVSVQ